MTTGLAPAERQRGSRRAIVTGGDRGIGHAVAVALARAGCDVGITHRASPDAAAATAREVEALGRHATVAQLDLADAATDPADVVERLADDVGGLDVFVNNAGEGMSAPFLDLSLDDWRNVLEVDLTGAFRCIQAAAQRMVDRGSGGRIVAVTSVHEHVPLAGSAGYCAAKGGLGLLVKVAALELAGSGITVNAVAPGEIATRMTGGEDVDPVTRQRRGIPAGRPGDANEVAAAVAWLASPDAAYVTGASLVVDGGLLLMAAEANRRLT